MAWSSYQLLLAGIMVVTGSINTLSTKWADELKSKGRDGEMRAFDHPFMQCCCMFFGETLCLLLFYIMYYIYKRRNDGSEDIEPLTKGNRNFNKFILLIPALCDMTATSITYIGLNLTYASSFQMFRGSVLVFVGLLSVGFLNRVLKRRQWSGIFFVIVGLTIVGVADFMTGKPDDANAPSKNGILTGDILIVIAQVITAVQMCVEEKFVIGLDVPPLQAIGLEGLFGFCVLASLQIPFYYIHVGPPFSNNSREVLEDVVEAFIQIGNNYLLGIALAGNIISIAFFNFAGISLTQQFSATTRMVLDSVRTIVIWCFSLLFLHQLFYWLQLLGFIALIIGMCLYNGITFKFIFLAMRSCWIRLRYRTLNEEVVVNSAADQVGTSEDAEPYL